MGCGSSVEKAYEADERVKAEEMIKAEMARKGWVNDKDGKSATAKDAEAAEAKAKGWAVDYGSEKSCEGTATHRHSVLQSNADYERAVLFSSKIPLFSHIPKGDLPLIVKSMNLIEYKAGETVIQQGEMTDRLFIILSGQVEVVRQKENGDGTAAEILLTTLSSGDYFGEQELLLAEEARATARAIGDVVFTYSITHDAFWKLDLHERLHIPKRKNLIGLREAQLVRQETQAAAVQKSKDERKFLVDALGANQYLPLLFEVTDGILEQLVTAAVRCTISAGEVLFRQGDLHSGQLCVVESGSFDFVSDGRVDAIDELAGSCGAAFGSKRMNEVGSWHACHGAGCTFGEMELFYSLPARATVTAVEASVFWSVGRADFTTIFAKELEARIAGRVKALRGVDNFSGLYNEELQVLAESVTEVSYTKGEDVLTQGEASDVCFVLVQGEAVSLRDDVEDDKRYSACSEQGIANFFGYNGLLDERTRRSTIRIASDTAHVLCIDRETFELILQPLADLLQRDERTQFRRALSGASLRDDLNHRIKNNFMKGHRISKSGDKEGGLCVKREDLELTGNLGSGSFGYVDLAVEKGTGRRFALKQLHQANFSEPWHRRQVKMEMQILSVTHSRFIVRLYETYKEPRSLALLMELVTGGDLRHALYRDKIRGNENCARFYCAGILLATQHCHERHIVHRDLKPENVMLDEHGWPKVTDFGLAKFCVGKTFTVSGTPNYMAPEAFQPAGHGLAVDWWSLGCLTFELMAGKTPFESATGNFQEIFMKINKGIKNPDKWPWPKNFGPHFRRFLYCLLQTDPSDRLPMRHHGINKLQEHDWYERFEWPAYKDMLLKPPVVPPSLRSLRPCTQQEDTKEDDGAEPINWDDDSDTDH